MDRCHSGGAATIISEATFSPCRKYRYTLERAWDEADLFSLPGSRLVVIGLNPSTADETQDDPTIRRCIGFAKRWGYGGLIMLNLFAYRSTCPKAMKREAEPVGPGNNEAISRVTSQTMGGDILVAWGNHGTHRNRDRTAMLELIQGTPMCLGVTKQGCPKHPLYLPSDAGRYSYRLPRQRREFG